MSTVASPKSFASPESLALHRRPLADHSADGRMLLLGAGAVVVGSGGAFAAWILLKAIAIATNLFWFGRLSLAPVAITDAAQKMQRIHAMV